MADSTFKAFVARETERGVEQLNQADLGADGISIKVEWSSVNYKDALAASPNGKVARISPLVPGIDLAGTVADDDGGPAFPAGTQVLAHGYDLGVSRFGGFAQYARVPAEWLVPLPRGLSPRDSMVYGTAGFTAALSVLRVLAHGVDPASGEVLVLGATGGVGSMAAAMLAHLGFHVVASTGKSDHAFLGAIGVETVLSRTETSISGTRPLDSQRWAAVVDPVGGSSLAYALRTVRYGGCVASSGNTGGTEVVTSVLPFILRAVSLYGIDSVQVPIVQRRAVWQRMASDLKPASLGQIPVTEVQLDALAETLQETLSGGSRGRTVVSLDEP